MRAAALALAVLAAPAWAAPQGCFARQYSQAHLAANPAQTVAALELWLDPVPADTLGVEAALVRVAFRDGAQVYRQVLFCHHADPAEGHPPRALRCGVECDGGSFVAWERAPGELLLRTEGFVVEGGCGAAPLADGSLPDMRFVRDGIDGTGGSGGPTTYLLRATDGPDCAVR